MPFNLLQKLQTLFYEVVELVWGSYLLWVMKVLYWVIDFVMDRFESLWDAIVQQTQTFMTMIVASMPGVSCGFGAAGHWIAVANSWLPISESVGLMLGYWTFVAAFCGAKYVWKAFPLTG